MSAEPTERLLKVLRSPHISEKTARLSDSANCYAFRIAVDADKAEVKAAVEALFKVEVAAVRTVNMAGKHKRRGRRADWKKAYVSLLPGYSIELGEAP